MAWSGDIPDDNITTIQRFAKTGYGGTRTKAEPTEIDLCAIRHRPDPDYSYSSHSDTRVAWNIYIIKLERRKTRSYKQHVVRSIHNHFVP